MTNLLRSQSFFPAYYLYPSTSVSYDYDSVMKWVKEFYNKYSIKPFETIENCPDILFLKPDKSGSYKVEQISEIYRFQETRPLNNKNKFCVLFPVNEISETVFNKLLKILEEPYNGLVFLLFDQKKSALLDTISSRVVEIRLSPEDLELMNADSNNQEIKDLFSEIFSFLPSKNSPGNWEEFLNVYRENRTEEKSLLAEFTHWVAEKPDASPVFKEKFPGLMQWLEESKLYNNPISERAYFLYQFAGAFNKSL